MNTVQTSQESGSGYNPRECNPRCQNHQNRLTWDQVTATIALRIRQSINLRTILQTTADEVHRLLKCDRVLVYRLAAHPLEVNWSGTIVVEAVSNPRWSLIDQVISDTCFTSSWITQNQENWYSAIADINRANLTPCYAEFLTKLQVKACFAIPILNGNDFWGLLIAHHCQSPRSWEDIEIEGLQQLAIHVGIAIHQAALIEELQASKAQLETQVAERTAELEQANQQLFQLAAIVESSQDAILSSNHEGIIQSWNQASEQLLGYTAAEMIGQSALILVPVERQAEQQAVIRCIAQGGSCATFETQRRHKDGSLIDVALSVFATRDRSGQIVGVSAILRDIRKQKEVANKLAQQSAILQIFYETSSLMMGVVEVSDNDILHISQNLEALKFFNVTPEEMTGKWASELGVSPEYLQLWISHYRRSQEQGELVQFEYKHVLPTETYRLLVSVTFLGFADSQRPKFSYTIQDISDRYQAAENLLKAEQFSRELKLMESIFDVVLAGYWDWDIASDFVYLSPGLKRILGYENDELMNSRDVWKSLVLPDDLPNVLGHLDQHIQSFGKIPYHNEVRYRHKNGSIVWIKCSGQVIEWDNAGRPSRMIGCHINITEQRQAEETLRQSEATNRALIAAIPDFLVRMHKDGRQLAVMNEEAIHCIYPHNSLQPTSENHLVTEIMPWAIAQERIQLAHIALETGKIQQQEYEFFDGNELYYEEARIVPLWEDYVLVMVRDITSRKRIELDLKAAKSQLELVIQASSEGFWDWDLVTGAIYFSPEWKAMLGYAEHELENSLEMWKSMIFPEDYVMATKLVNDYNNGVVDTFEATQRFRHKNGSTVYILSRAIHLKDDYGVAIRMIGSHLDLTPVVTIQEALKTSEMQLSSLLNSSLDGIMAFRSIRNSKGKIVDFEWLLSNPTACAFVGCAVEDLIGKRLLEEMPGVHGEGFFEDYVRVVESGQPEHRELHHKHDGFDVWIESSIVKLGDGFSITFRNITSLKESEKALQVANQQLEDRFGDLKQRNTEMIRLSEMSDFLQACLNLNEAYGAIASLLEPLFPNCSGGLFITSNSRNRIENVASWGLNHSEDSFHPKDCWGLRRGRIHKVGIDRPSLRCKHVHGNSDIHTTLCIPTIAQGEILGLLYLCAEIPTALPEPKQQLARTVAEQIALAIANLNLREKLQTQSTRDPLTGLFNRRYLEEFLDREITRALRHKHPIGVIMLDIDHFKQVNDTYGHDTGDYVLQIIGKLLNKHVRGSDIACRYGGEEMTLILPELSLEDTYTRAESIRSAIMQLNLHHNSQLLASMTASLGVAAFPQHGGNGSTLIQAADAALYRAKSAGRNQVMIAVPYP